MPHFTLALVSLFTKSPVNNYNGKIIKAIHWWSPSKENSDYQIKSRQWEQNVGCRKKVAMNLCPLTWWTRRRMAPRRRFNPWRSLNSRGFSLLVFPHASVGDKNRKIILYYKKKVNARLVLSRAGYLVRGQQLSVSFPVVPDWPRKVMTKNINFTHT